MLFTLQQLEIKSKNRPNGYYDDILLLAKKIDNNQYELSEENYNKIIEKYKLPTPQKLIKNIIEAGIQAIEDSSERTEEEIKLIKKICEKCPFLIKENFRCSSCGCYLSIKSKLLNWHCPINKW